MDRDVLLSKYSTGRRYISPAMINYPSGTVPTYYWCSGTYDDFLKDYKQHLNEPPNTRVLDVEQSVDGLFRAPFKLTQIELDWLYIEYKLRKSLESGKAVLEFVL